MAGKTRSGTPAKNAASKKAAAAARGSGAGKEATAGNRSWGGRFDATPDRKTQAFTASIGFDQRLYRYDIRGSIAHASMLAAVGILTAAEKKTITAGLREIETEIAGGKFVFDIADEDIHMAIERRLIAKTGAAGAKLHTARSRNDQVVTDVRLYVKDALAWIDAAIGDLQCALLEVSLRHQDAILPGYTHMQRAQPVLLAHHLLAYYEMLARDRERLGDARGRVDILPLGAGALAGTTLPIDRARVAEELGFARVADNSIDAVADRDFILEPLADIAILFAHVSRLAGEIVLWATAEYGFVRLHDAYSTGSSMMPQKKNPDIAELARGKSGRVVGNLVSLLVTTKGLPLAYNSDLQEDKEPLFDSVDTAISSLTVLGAMVRSLTFDEAAMRRAASDSFLLATDLAEILVARGVPFRQAHEVVGKIVRHCLAAGVELTSLGSTSLGAFSPALGPDGDRKAGVAVASLLTVEQAVARRTSAGGTSASQVKKRLRTLARKHGVTA
ncbi:MAG: argininosuccinate lyase [Deltaproteobacteria bacterium]|nr:argininosuccinate lyase [Deltaproteobacteria bacterium]